MAGLFEPPGCRVRGPVRYACAAAYAGVIVFGSLASQAQIPQPSTLNRTVNLNYVYAAELGFGGYSLDGLTAQVFTLPLDYTLHDVLRDGWAELEIPIGNRTVFKPFGQFGVGHTFGFDAGSPNFYVFSGFSEHYVSLQLGVELRHPLGFRMGTLAPDLGVYTIYYYYPVPLVFSRFLEPELKIVNQGEIGFSIGSATEFRLLGLPNPRIGAGFIFGGGLTVLRINFGFQF